MGDLTWDMLDQQHKSAARNMSRSKEARMSGETYECRSDHGDPRTRIPHTHVKRKTATSDELTEQRWRVGRKVGRTIYAQLASEPADSDPLIGVMDTRALARVAIDAHNSHVALASSEAQPQGRVFTIWVCPECGYYDADPILRRGPDSSHAPMRCFACGKRAEETIDYKRLVPRYREGRRQEARKSGPLMVETKVAAARAIPAIVEVDGPGSVYDREGIAAPTRQSVSVSPAEVEAAAKALNERCPAGICQRKKGHEGPHRDTPTFTELAERAATQEGDDA